MVCFILQLVSWLFSLLSPSSLHRGLMALSPLSFTSVISCWAGSLSDKTGRMALFSGCISRHVSHCVYGNVFRSLFILLSCFSERKDAHSPWITFCLGSSENEGQRANCKWECDRQRGVNNLAHHSGFCCSSKHEQNTVLWFPLSDWPAWQKTNIAALCWVEGKDSLKGVYL